MELNKDIDMFKTKVKCIKKNKTEIKTETTIDKLLDEKFLTKYYKK
tara:strand:- start:1661 stop:1798 length:138 start_codon:yes stop_codon:yes gene_type:complete